MIGPGHGAFTPPQSLRPDHILPRISAFFASNSATDSRPLSLSSPRRSICAKGFSGVAEVGAPGGAWHRVGPAVKKTFWLDRPCQGEQPRSHPGRLISLDARVLCSLVTAPPKQHK
jgi:hypothetical protein